MFKVVVDSSGIWYYSPLGLAKYTGPCIAGRNYFILKRIVELRKRNNGRRPLLHYRYAVKHRKIKII